MPALCAHPLAAIPFKRYDFPLSALIIGSMMPDGVYFIPFHPISEQFGHTLLGVGLFCLPVGVLMYWMFHVVVKYPAFSMLPMSHQARLWTITSRQPSWSISHIVRLIVALFIGTMTHIAWDSCTHSYGWTVQHVPLLRIALLHTSSGTLRLYKVLQHGSTIVGTAVLLWWYLAWIRTAAPSPLPSPFHHAHRMKRSLVIALLGGAGAYGLLIGYLKVPVIHNLSTFRYFVMYTAKAGIAALLPGLLVFSIIWHVLQRYEERKKALLLE